MIMKHIIILRPAFTVPLKTVCVAVLAKSISQTPELEPCLPRAAAHNSEWMLGSMWTHCCRESSDPAQHITPISIPNLPLQVIFSIRKWGWLGIIRFMNWSAGWSPMDRGECEDYLCLPLAWGYPKVKGVSKKIFKFHLQLRAAGDSTFWEQAEPPAWQGSTAVLWSWVSALFQQCGWHKQQPWSCCQLHTATEGNEDSFFPSYRITAESQEKRESSLWPHFYFWKKQIWVTTGLIKNL